MKRLVLLSVIAMGLCGCGKWSSPGVGHGRYQGVGTFPVGRMWAQMNAAAAKDPTAGGLRDDEQIIVVVDSKTGEVRECGNLSGHCISLQPWSGAVPAAPASLAKHADQLDQEAEAKAAKAKAAE